MSGTAAKQNTETTKTKQTYPEDLGVVGEEEEEEVEVEEEEDDSEAFDGE